MRLLGALPRALAILGLLAGMGAIATPAFAAPADIALLKSYLGSWKGRGKLIGRDSETVVCKLTMTDGNDDKINYSGRCSLAGTQLSVNGTIAYIDAAKRYEAAMTSNATFTGTAIGQKQGNGVVFNLREKDKDEQGNDLTVTSKIALVGGKIAVEFQVVFNTTSETIRAVVPFTK